MDKEDKFVTLRDFKIEDMWGLCAGSFVYEGCNVLLSDGRPCSLGKNARRQRSLNRESPAGPHSRERSNHVCCNVGAGKYMYCFAVQVGDFVIQVNEDMGTKLMGMSGQAFKANFGTNQELIEGLCTEVKQSAWTFTCVEKINGDGYVSHNAINVVMSRLHKNCTGVQVLTHDDGESELKPSSSSMDRVCRKNKEQGPLQKLGRAVLDFSEEIVDSLKSFAVTQE